MPTSYSTGNHLNFLSLGARAARSYAAELPREAVTVAARLEVFQEEIATLNARQEKAKQQLALLTRELKAKKTESMRERARLIRLAEATFGPRDPRIKEFRPATEGKVRTARGPNAARTAEKRRDAGLDEPAKVAPPSPRAAAGPEDPRGEPGPAVRSRPAPSGSESMSGPGPGGGAALTGHVCPFGCAQIPRRDGEREPLREARGRPAGARREE